MEESEKRYQMEDKKSIGKVEIIGTLEECLEYSRQHPKRNYIMTEVKSNDTGRTIE